MRIGRRLSRARLVFSLAIVTVLSGTGSLLAATRTWTGAGGDANWTTVANWGGVAPSAGDDLVFPGGALQLANNNDLAAGTSFNTISFTGATGGYLLNGNSIQLVAGISAANTANDNRVYVPIQLTAPQTFACTITSPSGLYIEGAVNLGANTLTLNLDSSSGIRVDGTITGTGGVTITGTGGSAVIFGTDTYSGPTSVQGGTLLASDLSGAGPVTVMTGANIQLFNAYAVGALTVNNGAAAEFEGGGTNQIGNTTNFTGQSGSMVEYGMYSATNYGQLVASGAVTLNNPILTVGFVAYTSTAGQAFTIINKTSPGAITGTFNGLAEGATFTSNGRTYRITYVGGDGNDAVVTDVTGLPPTEPIPTTSGAGLVVFVVLLAGVGILLLRRHLS
jgi:hypothetical protein